MAERVALYLALIALLLLGLLSGCITQQLSIAERHKCMELSGKASAFVPKCLSQEACFEEVQKEFFSFDESVFDAGVRAELFAFKNHLAASWFYFNQARESTQAINRMCSSKQGTSEIPFQLNELNHALSLAFRHADKAFQRAFAAILLEAHALESQEIGLVSEEQLFDSFAVLNENLNDLALMRASNRTFAGHYLKETFALQYLVRRTGFSRQIVAEKSLLDLLEGKTMWLSNEMQKRASLTVPFLSHAIDSFVSYVNRVLKIRQAAVSLEGFPSFEFFQAFSNLAGTNNSSAELFSNTLKDTASNKARLIKRNAELTTLLEKSIVGIEQAIELSSRDFSSLDQGLIRRLYSMLSKQSDVVAQRFEIEGIEGFREKALARLKGLKRGFLDIRRAKLLGELSLGRESLELKRLLSNAKDLNENIAYLRSEVLDGVHVLCAERVNVIASRLESLNVVRNTVTTVADIRSRLLFKLSRFEESHGTERLSLCRDIILGFESLGAALQDFYSFKAKRFSSFNACVQRVSKLLSAEPHLGFRDAGVRLREFKLRLDSIRAIPESEQTIEQLHGFCSSLERDLEAWLQSSAGLKGLFQSFSGASLLLDEIVSLSKRFPHSVSKNALSALVRERSSLENYFDSKGLELAVALPRLPELRRRVASFNESVTAVALDAAASALSETFSMTMFFDSTPVLGFRNVVTLRVVLESPFDFDLLQPLAVKLPVKAKVIAIASASPNVLSARSENEWLLIALSSLPKGFTVIDLNSEVIAYAEEKTELLSVNQAKAVFKKTVSIEAEHPLPALKAKFLLLPDNALKVGNVRVYGLSGMHAFSVNGNTVSLTLHNVKGNQTLVVFFSVANPLEVSSELIEEAKVTQTKRFYRFKLIVRNMLHVPLEKVQVTAPLNIEGNAVSVKEFVDAFGKSVKFKVLSGKNLALWLDSIYPGQKAEAFLALEVEDAETYWEEQLALQKTRAFALSKSASNRVREKALGLLKKLNSFQELFFTDKEQLREFNEAKAMLETLEAENSDFFESAQEFSLLKSDLVEQINAIEEEKELLLRLGFEGEAANAAKIIEDLNAFIHEAQGVWAEGKAKAAVEKLFEAHAIASAKAKPTVKGLISRQRDALAEQFKRLSESAGFVEAAFEKELKLGVPLLFQKLDSALEHGGFAEAKLALDALSEKLSYLNNSLNSKAKLKAKELALLVNELSEAVKQRLPSKIKRLSSMLEGVGEEEFVEAKYVAPISIARLNRISLEAASLDSILSNEKTKRFLLLHGSGEHAAALKLFEAFSEEFAKAKDKAVELEAELDRALQQLEEDALASFNTAVQLFNSPGFRQSQRVSAMLSKSEAFLKEGELLKSILLSRSVVAILLNSSPRDSFPLYMVPLIVAALLVAGLRLKRKSSEEARREKLKRVLRVWDE